MAQFKKWRIPLNHLIIYYFPQGGEGCSSAEDPRPLQLKSEWRSAVSGIRKVFWSYIRVQDFHCHLCILTHHKCLSGFDCFFHRFQSSLFWSKTWICTTGGYTVAYIILSEELNMGDHTMLLSILQPLWRGRYHDVDQVLLQVRGWSSQDVEPQDVQTHWKGAQSSSSQCCQDFHQNLLPQHEPDCCHCQCLDLLAPVVPHLTSAVLSSNNFSGAAALKVISSLFLQRIWNHLSILTMSS